MKIALIKENLRKSSTTSNQKSSTTKETYQIKTPELVPISPLDIAQYENVSSIINKSEATNKKQTIRTTDKGLKNE